jgi:uncharacterized protein YbjQ (UPF0145 family)
MKISRTHEIEGRRIAYSIGRIEAASAWHAPGNDEGGIDWKQRALERLVAAAAEYEADAIVNVDFEVDGLRADHLSERLERVCVTGVAVRLARAPA